MNQLVSDAALAADAALFVGARLKMGEFCSHFCKSRHAYPTNWGVFRDVETTIGKLVD